MAINSIPLSDFFELVKKPRLVLGTTYTLSLAFFEANIFPLFNRSDLEGCLIVCDRLGYRRALTESPALMGAGQDYMVAPAPIAGCFHPKVWLVIGDDCAALLVGSGNLTQSGFMTNAEFFDAIQIDGDNPASHELLESISSFVQGLEDLWGDDKVGQSLVLDTLASIWSAVKSLPAAKNDKEDAFFLHSFRGNLLSQLPITAPTEQLYIAAPYFGDSLEGLKLLGDRLQPSKIHLFPAVHDQRATDLPLEGVRAYFSDADLRQVRVNGKANAFAHLKLYGALHGDRKGWMFCTSANCTRAAWSGTNVEAGILRHLPSTVIQQYFQSTKDDLPTQRIGYSAESPVSSQLHCWANDDGNGLSLGIAGPSRDLLPLRIVQITVRAGSHRFGFHRDLLFEEKPIYYVRWEEFQGYVRQRHLTQRLDMEVSKSNGERATGSCIIEDLTLLTANSRQRSALRGIHALFDSESMPEIGDVAAVFTVMNDLFESPIVRASSTANNLTNSSDGKTETESSSVAVWPPKPEFHYLHVVGRSGVGRLQWFQQILQTLLRLETPRDALLSNSSSNSSQVDDEQKEEDSGKSENPEAEKPDWSIGQELFKRAKVDYDKLSRRLHGLCPNREQAPNLLILAIAGVLFALAARRKAWELIMDSKKSSLKTQPDPPLQAKAEVADQSVAGSQRVSTDEELGTTTRELAEAFIRLLVFERKQGNTFVPPHNFRYRSERFPPLMDDLIQHFKVPIHPYLANSLLALTIHWKLGVEAGMFNKLWPRLVKLFCEDDYSASPQNVKSCLRTWRWFLGYEPGSPSDEDFVEAFGALFPGSKIALPE